MNLVDTSASHVTPAFVSSGIPQFAHAKANACIIMRSPSSAQFRDTYVQGGDLSRIAQMNSMVTLASNVGGMAPFPGGVLLVKKMKNAVTGKMEQNILGAVGVSGARGVEDELCALAGLKYLEAADISEQMDGSAESNTN